MILFINFLFLIYLQWETTRIMMHQILVLCLGDQGQTQNTGSKWDTHSLCVQCCVMRTFNMKVSSLGWAPQVNPPHPHLTLQGKIKYEEKTTCLLLLWQKKRYIVRDMAHIICIIGCRRFANNQNRTFLTSSAEIKLSWELVNVNN